MRFCKHLCLIGALLVFLVSPLQAEEVFIQSQNFNKIYDQNLKRYRLVKDSFLISFDQILSQSDIETELKDLGLKLDTNLGKGIYLVKPIGKISGKKLNQIKFLIDMQRAKNKSIKGFDFNEYREIDLLSNGAEYAGLEWHISNDGINGIKKGADISVNDAWKIADGQGIRVAVIDTGIDLDLKNKINILDKGVNARYIDQSLSKEKKHTAIAPKKSKENHATAIAGIIAAKHCGNCLLGVAPGAEVIPIRLIDDSGLVSTAQIIYAFNQAAELGAQIINCSWGASTSPVHPDQELQLSDIEKNLYQELASNGNNGKGILIVFAAGNKAYRDFKYLPQARSEYVLAVGASDSADEVTTYSNLAEELDLLAPGGDELHTIITYDRSDIVKHKENGTNSVFILGYNRGIIAKDFYGTSASSAVVAGVAALVYSVNPNLTASQVKEILMASADPLECPEEGLCGSGKVNAVKAVEMAKEL